MTDEQQVAAFLVIAQPMLLIFVAIAVCGVVAVLVDDYKQTRSPSAGRVSYRQTGTRSQSGATDTANTTGADVSSSRSGSTPPAPPLAQS